MMVLEEKKDMQLVPLLDGWDNDLNTMPDWVQSLRSVAAETLYKTGLPTPAWEEWKYTNLRALEKLDFCKTPFINAVPEISPPFKSLNSITLQIVNDKLLSDIPNLPEGLEISPLSKILEESWVEEHLAVPGNFNDTPMEALNVAFLQDGLAVRVRKDVQIEAPLFLMFQHKNSKDTLVTMPRILIVLEDGAKLDIIEHHTGDGSYLSNQVTTITVNKNANLGHYIWQNDDSKQGHNFNTTRLNCFDNSRYESCALTTGAILSRHEIFTDLLGSNIECILSGAYRLGGDQHYDTTIKMGHLEPQSKSKQVYKGVINEQARAVFQGKIYVHRRAQGTDGYQLNNALLLSKEAQINVKPELEIYADDVICSHGATSGDLDEASLFYMRSRGITEEKAKELLVEGFLIELFDNITHSEIRDIFLNIINKEIAE